MNVASIPGKLGGDFGHYLPSLLENTGLDFAQIGISKTKKQIIF